MRNVMLLIIITMPFYCQDCIDQSKVINFKLENADPLDSNSEIPNHDSLDWTILYFFDSNCSSCIIELKNFYEDIEPFLSTTKVYYISNVKPSLETEGLANILGIDFDPYILNISIHIDYEHIPSQGLIFVKNGKIIPHRKIPKYLLRGLREHLKR